MYLQSEKVHVDEHFSHYLHFGGHAVESEEPAEFARSCVGQKVYFRCPAYTLE